MPEPLLHLLQTYGPAGFVVWLVMRALLRIDAHLARLETMVSTVLAQLAVPIPLLPTDTTSEGSLSMLRKVFGFLKRQAAPVLLGIGLAVALCACNSVDAAGRGCTSVGRAALCTAADAVNGVTRAICGDEHPAQPSPGESHATPTPAPAPMPEPLPPPSPVSYNLDARLEARDAGPFNERRTRADFDFGAPDARTAAMREGFVFSRPACNRGG